MPKILVLSSYFLNVKWKIKAYNKPKQIRTRLISISKKSRAHSYKGNILNQRSLS